MENMPDLGVISWYPATGMFQKVVKSESYYPHPPYMVFFTKKCVYVVCVCMCAGGGRL